MSALEHSMKTSHSQSIERAREASLKLLEYCRSNEWAGYDPYDALNSPLFSAFPILDSKIPRLVLYSGTEAKSGGHAPLVTGPQNAKPEGTGFIPVGSTQVLKRRTPPGRRDDFLDDWPAAREPFSRLCLRLLGI